MDPVTIGGRVAGDRWGYQRRAGKHLTEAGVGRGLPDPGRDGGGWWFRQWRARRGR